MTLVIATDEAGYGPRLGPLVIVATAWQLDDGADLDAAHGRLAQPLQVTPDRCLRIDDSKRLFVRRRVKGASEAAAAGLSDLDLLTEASAQWIAAPSPDRSFARWLRFVAGSDIDDLGRRPWFAELQSAASRSEPPDESDAACIAALIRHWTAGGLKLLGVAARVLDADRFNELVEEFSNKAELLSHATCELALRLRQTCGYRHPATLIYSDRHGGRAYYGGLLQHHCPELNMQVLSESAALSRYRLHDPRCAEGERIEWSFTVGGDSFAPVALSSVIAKSTRERLMGCFNRYFQSAASGSPDFGGCLPLRPTAGYGADATRFLADIGGLRKRLKIADHHLIRSR